MQRRRRHDPLTADGTARGPDHYLRNAQVLRQPLPCGTIGAWRSSDGDGTRRARGPGRNTAEAAGDDPRRRHRPAGEADVEPVPDPRRERDPRPGRLGLHARPRGRSGDDDRRGRGHGHLRAAGRRDPPARVDAARGAAAQDHHPRRRGHRAGNRVLVVPQRHAARVGAGDGAAHRRRADRRRPARQRARRAVPRLPQLLRHPRLRPAVADPARAGQALRPAAPRPPPRPPQLLRGARRDLPEPELRRRAGRLRRRHRVRPGRAVPDAGHLHRQRARDQRLHLARASITGRSSSGRPTT